MVSNRSLRNIKCKERVKILNNICVWCYYVHYNKKKTCPECKSSINKFYCSGGQVFFDYDNTQMKLNGVRENIMVNEFIYEILS